MIGQLMQMMWQGSGECFEKMFFVDAFTRIVLAFGCYHEMQKKALDYGITIAAWQFT